jgi:hypothetical protein
MNKSNILKVTFFFLILLVSTVWAVWTPPSDMNLRDTYSIINAIDINGTNIYQNGNVVLDSSDEANLNVNSSNSTTYWDDETSQADLNVNNSNTSTYWDDETSQADLNVNRSNYWDGLDTSADIIILGTIATGVWQATQITDAYLASLNASKLLTISYLNSKITIEAANITDPDNLQDTHTHNSTNITSQDLMNVNSSTYWDGETSQGDLNVNSSNYWDSLDSSSDITGLNSSNIESLNVSKIDNFDLACGADTFMTTTNHSDESITCTAISDVYVLNTGDEMAGDYNITGNLSLDGFTNHTLTDGTTRYFSNGCFEKVNSTGVFWIC